MSLKRFYLVVFSLLTLAMIAPTVAQDDELRQWASSAEASSEFGSSDWSAEQATGEPDTDDCGDAKTAWASADQENPDETLTLYYDTAVLPTQINVYQTHNPGAITSMDFLPADGGDPIVVNESADPGTDCPGIFTLNVTWENPVPIIGIVLHLDQTESEAWNEIDAVELVGTEAEDVETSETESEYSYDGNYGMSVTCDDGTSFDNGIEVRVIQMRAGFTYTATALGMNGFDPVLAVLNSEGQGLCTDDDAYGAEYGVWLPTTDEISPASTHSQIFFANNSNSAFANISLVVGGLNNQVGEFVLLLEGMALTEADNAGDMFSVQITPGMIASGVPPTAYMIAVTSGLDPLIALVDGDYNFMFDADGNYYSCDNAGYAGCWGESYDMTGYSVSRSDNRQLPGGPYDAMLRLPARAGNEWLFYNFLMRSSEMRTYGDYVVAFHLGIGE